MRVALFAVLALASCQAAPTADPAVGRAVDWGLPVHFLEIVTPEVEATCDALAEVHGVTFGEPVAEFGFARTAPMRGGGRVSVRAPLRETETAVIRPYVLVKDIDAAIAKAEAAGGHVALPPMAIPDEGRFAIYILGGIEHALWEDPPAP